MFIFFQGLPEQMFFSTKQEEKLAFFFCPCCKIDLSSETSAIFSSWLSYPLREGKHRLEEPTQSSLPWKIKQMNLAAFRFVPTPLITSNKTAEKLIPYRVNNRLNEVCLAPSTCRSTGSCTPSPAHVKPPAVPTDSCSSSESRDRFQLMTAGSGLAGGRGHLASMCAGNGEGTMEVFVPSGWVQSILLG